MIRAAGRGALAALAAALLGQVPPLLIDLFGGGLAVATAVRIGWLYTLGFNRVAIRIVGIAPDAGYAITFQGAVLGGTALVILVLYRIGATQANAAAPVRSRLAIGLAVALGYALPIAIVTAIMHLRLGTPGTFLPEHVDIHGVVWQSFLLPLAIGFAACAAGLFLADPDGLPPRIRAWITGGWRAFGWALGLSLVGLLVLATLRPQGTAHYSRIVTAPGPRAASLLLGHHLALAPNEAIFLLTPAMGGCVSARGSAGAVDVLCPRTVPDLGRGNDVLDAWVIKLLDQGRELPTAPAPAAMLLLLLVPASAVAVAGRGLGRAAGSRREALIRAVGATAVFASLVTAAAWASTFTLTVTLAASDTAGRSTWIRLGPRLPELTGLAIVWGLVGLSVGAIVSVRQKPLGPGPAGGDDVVPTSA